MRHREQLDAVAAVQFTRLELVNQNQDGTEVSATKRNQACRSYIDLHLNFLSVVFSME